MLLWIFSWVLSFLVQFNPINIDSIKDFIKIEYIILDAGFRTNMMMFDPEVFLAIETSLLILDKR